VYYCQVNFLLQLLLPGYLRGREGSDKAKSRNGWFASEDKMGGLKTQSQAIAAWTSDSFAWTSDSLLLTARFKVLLRRRMTVLCAADHRRAMRSRSIEPTRMDSSKVHSGVVKSTFNSDAVLELIL